MGGTGLTKGNRALPRGPHAEKPRPDEAILRRSGADLQNGWLARHGELYATEDRLVFVPTLLDTVLQAKRREIILDDITEIERFPVAPGRMPQGGRRPRMILHTDACSYEIMVPDLDGWIDTLQFIYRRRARRGRPYMPRVTREEYENPLLDDEETPPPGRRLNSGSVTGFSGVLLITITEKSRSAVLALTELAQRGGSGPVPILEVAEARGIPLHFLEQIFAGLRRAGVLQSQRGVKGGYSFRRSPVEVSILEVVETVDGRITPPGGEDAAWGSESVWTEAQAALADLLGGLTIADMQEREARIQDAPMFHI